MAEDIKTTRQYVTKIGDALFPSLIEPDTYYSSKNPAVKPHYHTLLILDTEDAQSLVQAARQFGSEMLGIPPEQVVVPFKQHVDRDKNIVPGKIAFKAKSEFQPSFYDVSNQEITNPDPIHYNSKLRLAGDMRAYTMGKPGVTFYLKSVQIVEYAELKQAESVFEAIQPLQNTETVFQPTQVEVDVDHIPF